MNEKLSCEIVRDLLPSYADGLTGSVTNQAIEAHLQECPECTAVLARMREPVPQHMEPAAEIQVDYLKKLRRRTVRAVVCCALAAAMLVTGLFIARVYIGGNETPLFLLNYDVAVENDTVRVTGSLLDGSRGCTRTVFEEADGVVTVRLYSAPVSIFGKDSYDGEYRAKQAVSTVCLGDMVVWEDGAAIDRRAAEAFAAKNQYVGNMPGNGAVAAALGVADHLGNYTNALQTSEEPYGWSLILDTQLPSAEEAEKQELMTADACAMLALIDNLGYVTWEYETEAGAQTLTITQEEASVRIGRSIKECAETATEVQTLLQELSAN